MSETEIEGEAHLCFPLNETWFQGYLVTLDNSQYTLFGSRCAEDGKGGDQNGFIDYEDALYSLSVFDHDQAMEYTLDPVLCSCAMRLCSLHSKQVHFQTDSVYKGQKATMLVQNMLPKLVEKNLQVYAGHMKISIGQKQLRPIIPYQTWVL